MHTAPQYNDAPGRSAASGFSSQDRGTRHRDQTYKAMMSSLGVPPTPAGEVSYLSSAADVDYTGGSPVDAGEDEAQLPDISRCKLEDFVRCSESHLWRLMMSFYDRKGVESWAQGIVPHFITCNAFIGRSYAQVFQGFIRDCATNPETGLKLDPNEPLYIIELGAGSGKFSFFMLKALSEMREVLDFPFERIVYVMTDFTETNFRFWESHPGLKPFYDSGLLDSAIFDAVNDKVIRLAHSNKVLGPGSVKNPICIVANYLFDTLCHDIFQVDRGVLKEGLISVGSKRLEEPDPLDPEIIKRFDNHFQYNKIAADYYKGEDGDDLHLQRLLNWYHRSFEKCDSGASILLPIGALRALRRLTSLSSGRVLVISGDKGNNHPEQFKGIMDPHIAVHGSFSVMVNYHAIGMYFISRGGFALHNPQEEASLKVSAFVLPGKDDSESLSNEDASVGEVPERRGVQRATAFPNLRSAFRTSVEHFGPNDFFVMQKSLKEDSPNPSLKSVVALLKLGDWDPDVFYKFRDTILNQVPTAGQKLRNDLCRGIPRVWANYYMLDKDKDIAFEIGRFYYGIREYDKALKYYKDSSLRIGEHHVTYHNMGLCHYSMGNLRTALEHFNMSLELNKDYEKARSWQQKVLTELNQGQSERPSQGLALPYEQSAHQAQQDCVDVQLQHGQGTSQQFPSQSPSNGIVMLDSRAAFGYNDA